MLKKLLSKLFFKYVRKTHKYPASCLVKRKNSDDHFVFEIEFNWYDENLEPVSIVREQRTHKTYSIRHEEMAEFVEYTGSTDF